MATSKKPAKKVSPASAKAKPKAPVTVVKPKAAIKKKSIASKRGAARKYTESEYGQFINMLAFVFTLLCIVFLAMAYYIYN